MRNARAPHAAVYLRPVLSPGAGQRRGGGQTRFAAYENSDGFARNNAGVEIVYAMTDLIALEVRYAWIDYEDRTRH